MSGKLFSQTLQQLLQGRRTSVQKRKRRLQRSFLRMETLECRQLMAADLGLAPMEMGPGAMADQVEVHESHFDQFANGMPAPIGRNGTVGGSGGFYNQYAPAGSRGITYSLLEGLTPDQTFELHSNPTADHTIYLDFNGQTLGPEWGYPLNEAEPWSLDGHTGEFSAVERVWIQEIWARVSEDFAPFNVNVTTEEPAPGDLVKQGADDTRWGVRAVISPHAWNGPFTGQAFVGSFTAATDASVIVAFGRPSIFASSFHPFQNDSINSIALVTTHEVGHALDLNHDGLDNLEYHPGSVFGGQTSWGPLMGAPFLRNITQWSNGDYAGATNTTEDDLSIITTRNGFDYLTDQVGDTPGDATEIAAQGDWRFETTGLIEKNDDVDVYSFWAEAGKTSLIATPLSEGPNLDIELQLHDASGNLIAISANKGMLWAEIKTDLPAAGQYFLSVDGVGENGLNKYSDYGSLGNYRVDGRMVPFGGSANNRPVANDDAEISVAAGASIMIDVLANDTDADGHSMTITDISIPRGYGTAKVMPDGRIEFQAPGGKVGHMHFDYTIMDEREGISRGQVHVDVTEGTGNLNPVANDRSVEVFSGEFITVKITDDVSDLDGNETNAISIDNVQNGNAKISRRVSDIYGPPAHRIKFTPTPGYIGPAQFTYTISDGQGGTATATVNVDVRAVNTNRAPVLRRDHVNMMGDESTVIDVLANDFDPDGDAFTVVGVDVPSVNGGTATVNGDGTIQFTAAVGFVGLTTFDYHVDGVDGHSRSMTVTVNVKEPTGNRAPVAEDDRAEVATGETVAIDIGANDHDPDGNVRYVQIIRQSDHGRAKVTHDGKVLFTAEPGFVGETSFEYKLVDRERAFDTATVTVNVLPGEFNTDPEAVRDDIRLSQDGIAVVNVVENDTDSDGDGHHNRLHVVNVVQPLHGNVFSMGTDKTTWKYVPDEGYAGTDSFNYTLADGDGGTDTGTVFIRVVDGGSNPVARIDIAISQGEEPLVLDVLANDTSSDGSTPTISHIVKSQYGIATVVDGKINYLPLWGSFRSYSTFRYILTDAAGAQAEGEVRIYRYRPIDAGNTAPIGVDDMVTTEIGTPVSISVLANDTDADNDTLSIRGFKSGANGRVQKVGNQIQYTPDDGFEGVDYFSYIVKDGKNGFDVAMVKVNVGPGQPDANTPPMAHDDSAVTDEGLSVMIDVLANDTDADSGDVISIQSVGTPSNGTVQQTDGKLVYTPNAGFNGNDSFDYIIGDGHGGTDDAVVSITVKEGGGDDDTIEVTTTQDGVDGSLRSAIIEANKTDGMQTIRLGEGTYTLTVAIGEKSKDSNGDLDVRDHLVIEGAGMGKTMISAEQIDRVLQVHKQAVLELKDLTVTGGDTLGSGGGIHANGKIMLTNVSVTSSNAAKRGGGIYVSKTGEAIISSSLVGDNMAGRGGAGIFVSANGVLTADHLTVVGNETTGSGGGAMIYGKATITNSLFSENTARRGGGMFVGRSGDVSLTGTELSENHASRDGGGIHNSGKLTLQRVKMDNTAGRQSSGEIRQTRTGSLTATDLDIVSEVFAELDKEGAFSLR